MIRERDRRFLRSELVTLLGVFLMGVGTAGAALEVETNPGMTVAPGGTFTVTLSSPIPGVNLYFMNFTGTEFGARLGTDSFFRSTDNPSVGGPIHASSFTFSNTAGSPPGLQEGGQVGTDNWMYVCHKESDVLVFNGWVQLDLTLTTVTPVLYVYDPDSPATLITLPEAVAAATPGPRDIQIKSVDFETGIIELHNFGPVNQSLNGWRFCTHDEDQVKKYSGSSGLNGVTVESGTSLFIYFNNDAPVVDSNNINRSSTGGSWASPLDSGAYGLGLYWQTSFGVGANIADHVQWSIGGVDNASADERSDEAQSGGVWTSQSQWVATSAATTKVILTDGSNGELHGPADYLVLPDFDITSFTRGASDVTLTWPVVNNLPVTVERSTTLLAPSWSDEETTTSSSSTLTGETDLAAFYRISYPLP